MARFAQRGLSRTGITGARSTRPTSLAVMKAGHALPGDRHGFDQALQSLPPTVHGAVMTAVALALWIMVAAIPSGSMTST